MYWLAAVSYTHLGEEQFCFPEQKQSARGIREILEPDVDDKYTLSDKLWSYLQNYAEKHLLDDRSNTA